MLRKSALALALSALLATPAVSATVEVAPFGEQDGATVYALALAGDIKPSDDAKVIAALDEALVEDRFPGFMMLSSNGGDTDASLGIARIAHEYGMPILVRAECVSGCAIIALSAWRGRLFVVESGAIGLHQAWVGENYAKATASLEATWRVAAALESYGVPSDVIRRMTITPPHEMTYLSDSELAAIGARVKH